MPHRHSTRWLGTVLGLVIVSLAAGCHDLSSPRVPVSAPDFQLMDGAHGGNTHFYFLPPAVPAPVVSGVFDPTQQPVVEICLLGGGACTAPLIARFTLKPPDDDVEPDDDQGRRPEFIKVSPRRGFYRVRWHTNEYQLDTARTYRISVLVGAVRLGFADVDLVASKRELRNVNTGEYVPLIDGKTLPIKFRIEQGAVAVVPPGGSVSVGSAGANLTAADGATALLIPSGALATTTSISVATVPAPAPGAGSFAPVVDLGPNGTVFTQPAALVMTYDPANLPAGTPPGELAIMTFDGTGWDYVPGSVVDAAAHTVSAPLAHLSMYTVGIVPRRADFTRTYDTASVGATSYYSAVVFDSLGRPLQNIAVRWTSDFPAIASIGSAPVYTDANGSVESPAITANSPGLTSIRVHVAGVNRGTRSFTVLAIQPPPPPGPAPQVAAGGKSSCERQLDGTVYCWGETSYGATDAATGVFSTIGGGGFHYCGIRADQTLGCWGYNSDLRATPPSGTFTQLAVGAEHNCAVRTDGAALCWGFGGDGRSSPPPGAYKQVAVGWVHGCGIRSDDTIVCWGQNTAGQATPPAGTYRAVSGGAYFTCALRMDYTISCWGDQSVAAVPSGQFTQLGASVGGHICAIRFSGTLACWGQNDFGQATPPSGTFVQVSEGGWHSCGVRTDQTPVCWGSNATGAVIIPPPPPTPPAPLPPGPQVISGGKSTCELPLTGPVFCWGETSYGATNASASAFTTVSGGGFHYCGIRTDQALECWGYNSDLRATPPGGSFRQLSVSAEDACALRTDGTAACWGFTADGRASPPPGTYKQITMGWYHGCAIKQDNTLTCWGRPQSGAEIQPPAGVTFREIAAGAFVTCGIRTNYTLACFGDPGVVGTMPTSGYYIALGPSLGGHMCAIDFNRALACWGQNDFGQANPPAGQFAQVSEGGWHSCGVKTDQSVVCWGSNATGALDIPVNQWTSAASMTPRAGFGGMINGVLYVAGGVSNNVFYDVLEAYHPASNSWTTRAPMAIERVYAAAAVLGGKLYVVGGIDRANNALARLDVYDPVSDTWTPLAPLPRARTYLAAAAVGGKLYVFGGATGDVVPFQQSAVADVDIYDPATNSWSSGAPMLSARYTMTAAALNGRIYLVGGYGPADGYQQPLGTVEVYDPASNSWSSLPNTITRRGQAPGVAGINGKLYVAGGFCFNCGNALQSLEVYDPSTNTWTQKASMVQGRWGAVADVLNGALYMAGGSTDGGANAVGVLEIYHP